MACSSSGPQSPSGQRRWSRRRSRRCETRTGCLQIWSSETPTCSISLAFPPTSAKQNSRQLFYVNWRRFFALVAVELKLGRFDARDKGQMELYLRWLDKYERQPGENPPLRLILCADKNQEQIELLELTKGSVRVANYLTELPPRELMERKLLESIEHARARTTDSKAAKAISEK